MRNKIYRYVNEITNKLKTYLDNKDSKDDDNFDILVRKNLNYFVNTYALNNVYLVYAVYKFYYLLENSYLNAITFLLILFLTSNFLLSLVLSVLLVVFGYIFLIIFILSQFNLNKIFQIVKSVAIANSL